MSMIRQTPADEPYYLIRTARAELPHGGISGTHRHPWHQLIYAERGAMTVETDTGVWAIPTGWAVWAAAKTQHTISFHKGCAYTVLYIRPSRRNKGPSRAMPVSTLLSALITRAGQIGMLDSREPIHRAIAALVADEVPDAKPLGLTLPLPRSVILRSLATDILIGVRRRNDLAALSISAGMSPRTFERRFAEETGMSFGAWRRHARLLAALRMCGEGHAISKIAEVAGYRSASAFIAAFRRHFGSTPGRPLTGLIQRPL